MPKALPKALRKALRCIMLVLLAAVLLFAAGMLSRVPAMRLQVNYGFHAVVAAFFYAAIVSAFQIKTARAWPVVLGTLVCGAFLGMMSPVMALAHAVPALVYLVVCLVMRACNKDALSRDDAAIVGAVVYAACAYVGTIAGGALFSGYLPRVADLPFLLLTVGLGIAGALVGMALARRIGRRA